MVSKRDEKSTPDDNSTAAEVELHKAQEVIQHSTDVDRWHSDNVDQTLFEREGSMYYDEDLREIQSFDEYLNSIPREQIIDAHDWLGSGATFLRKDDKARLVGVPLAFIQWSFVESTDYEGGWFVYAEVIDKHNNRYALTDGAKFGLRDELAQITIRNAGKRNHLLCKNGLQSRSYSTTDGDGNEVKVTVYSIAR